MLYRTICFLLLSLFCFLGPIQSFAFFDKDAHLLNMQNGLGSNTVSSIYKDQKGFVWLGTRNGLSRYDGTQIKNFDLEAGSEWNISAIEELNGSLLGVIANDRLKCFDREKELFIPIHFTDDTEPVFHSFFTLNDSVLCAMSYDRFCVMQLHMTGGDFRLSILREYAHFFEDEAPLICMDKLPDRRKVCIADEKSRLVFFDLDQPDTFHTRVLNGDRPVTINTLLYNEDGVWIGTMEQGAIYLHLPTLKEVKLTYSSSDNVLSHTDVYKIIRLREHSYLAATYNGYTLLYTDPDDPLKITTEVYNNILNFKYQNIETRMITAYYDANRILWIGTQGGGAIWSDMRSKFYNRYYQERHNEICAVLTDDENRLWMATFHKGIMRGQQPFGREKPLSFSTVGTDEVRQRKCVLSAIKDKEGNLWFGNADGTLSFIDKHTSASKIHTLFTEDRQVNTSPIWALFLDSRDRFWIGTQGGLLLLDRNSGISRSFHFKKDQMGEELPRLYIRAIAETKDGHLWLGTANKGILKMIDDQTLESNYEDQKNNLFYSVRSLLATSDSLLYIGYTTGLGVIDPQKNQMVKFYTTSDGLCSNFIGSLIEDNTGQIWVGSNSGISYYNQQHQLFYNYYISGSNRSAYLHGQTLFFGNNNSLTYFDPGAIINTLSDSAHVFFTALEVNNKPVGIGEKINGQVILNKEIGFTKAVDLNHDNRNFSISFNNLSFSANTQKFKYRLYPYQSNWLIANGGEKISYINLPAGDYKFEVVNLYQDGEPDKITTLQISISPHWSDSFWFRFLMGILVLGIVYSTFRWVRRRHQRRLQEVHLKQELVIANLEREKEKQVRLERENFFTNAAHELRTPLTLILSPLADLLHHTDRSDPAYARLQTIHKNGKSLHALVDQLLYVQKIEAGMVKLHLSYVDLNALLSDITDSFVQLSLIKKIDFQVVLPESPVCLWIDSQQISGAVSNLLSNAFKYTPDGGRILLTVERVQQDRQMYCRIIVADNGCGIPVELQGRIFDSFITGEQNPSISTKFGIGLRIVWNTMNMHHGSVTCNSTEKEGSTFILSIPEGKEHFSTGVYDEVAPSLQSSPESPDTDIEPVAGADRKNKTLLIIEDNEEIRKYIVSVFCKQYNILEAENGETGRQKATQSLPDLIISDIMMPVKDGLACCRELKNNALTAHIPVLLLTAKSEDADICEGAEVGADNYLMKPFNPAVLKSTVDNMILQRERLKRIYTKALMLKQGDADSREPEDDFMQQIIHVIEMNLSDETFNVKKLADQMNMSQPTLYRKLKQCSDLAAIEIIRSIRISKAAALILENQHSIQKISEMVGYSDVRTLRKHFSDKFGVCPSKYSEINAI
ncbi:MAG: two-component regulator propeller domain-containing protein [Bacteroidales bacterium]